MDASRKKRGRPVGKDRPSQTVVVASGTDSEKQPETFRVCPLGMQLYARKPLPEFQVLDFSIQLGDPENGSFRLSCQGVVVHCRPVKHSKLHRVWVMFENLTEAQKKRLQRFAQDHSFLCPHCENF